MDGFLVAEEELDDGVPDLVQDVPQAFEMADGEEPGETGDDDRDEHPDEGIQKLREHEVHGPGRQRVHEVAFVGEDVLVEPVDHPEGGHEQDGEGGQDEGHGQERGQQVDDVREGRGHGVHDGFPCGKPGDESPEQCDDQHDDVRGSEEAGVREEVVFDEFA